MIPLKFARFCCTLAILCISSFTVAQKLPNDTSTLCSVIADMTANDQLHRKELSSLIQNKGPKKKIDSLWKLQLKIDNDNTQKLIALTKKYGWLSEELLSCDFKPLVFLIFRHSQEDYFEEINLLINKALENEDLSAFHHKIVKNHLEGRPKF